jgi:protein-S-isoprenylcysteine O-methyltransferase Ste14
MDFLFLASLLGVVVVVPVHFLSIEHIMLEREYGEAKGRKIGDILSYISGWGFFVFWAGIWFSPQPRFTVFAELEIVVPLVNFPLPLLHLIVFVPLFLAGAWLGIAGVRETGLKVAETHRARRVVSSGVYSVIRHPQYLGGLLAHLGLSFLVSAWFSMLSTPLLIFLICLMSEKEETELIKEFGDKYKTYKKRVPMFIPKLQRRKVVV